MGTILTQQVNPWGAIAANLAGSLIGDMLKRSREANQNRKLNALFAEAQNSLNAPQAQNFIAQSQVMPEDYDVNPWAKAFHQNYTPMTQYNIATADVNPLVQAAQQRQPTVQDLRNAITANLGTKRFSMLDPALVEQYMTPFYQSMEQQNQEAKKQAALDAIRNAQSDKDRLNEAQIGAAGGYLPDSVLRSIQGQYQYENPSAADIANNDFRNKQFNESVRQFDTNTGLNYAKIDQAGRQFDATMDYNRSKDAQNQENFMRTFEAQRNDSNWERGYKERILAGEEQQQEWLRGQQEAANRLKALEDEEKSIIANIQRYRENIDSSPDPNSGNLYSKMILNAEARLSEIAQERAGLLHGKPAAIESSDVSVFPKEPKEENTAQHAMEWKNNNAAGTATQAKANNENNKVQEKQSNSPKVWDSMVKGAYLTSSFGMRGKKHHNGVDLAVKAGSDIKVPDYGVPFTVKEVKTDAPEKGYGNYVVLSGNVGEHQIELKMAHMQNDSINLSKGQQINAGDIIGKVGNTGRTGNSQKGFGDWYEGKNYGYHLHLEATYDGKTIDPAKLSQMIEDNKPMLERADGEIVTLGQLKKLGGNIYANMQKLALRGFSPINQEQNKEYYKNLPPYITGNAPKKISDYSVF